MRTGLRKLFGNTLLTAGIGSCFGLLPGAAANAQNTWQAAYGFASNDAARGGVVALATGEIVTAGECEYLGQKDIFIVKTDGCYTALWTKRYDLGGEEIARKIRQTADGGFIVTGDANKVRRCGTSNDLFLMKLDAGGNVQWVRTYGGAQIDQGWDVQVASDGYVVAGATTSFGSGGYDGLLLKADLSGNWLWSFAYGNNNDDYFRSCALCANGDILAVGAVDKSALGASNIYLVRAGSGGGAIFQAYGGPTYGDDIGWRVIECGNGDIAIAGGTTDLNTGKLDGYLIRTQFNGAYIADRTCGSSNWDDELLDMTELPNGHLLVTGYMSHPAPPPAWGSGLDMYVGEFDAGLNLANNVVHGGVGDEEGWGIAYVPNPGGSPHYAAAGWTNSFGAGNQDMYVVKQIMGVPGFCRDFTSAVTPTLTQPYYGFSPLYYPVTYTYDLGCDAQATVRVDGTTTLICSDCIGGDGGLLKPSTSEPTIASDAGSIASYPSPVKRGEKFNLRYSMPEETEVAITISDLTGSVVYSDKASGAGEVAIPTEGWAAGTYLIQVKGGGAVKSTKVVVGDR
jgi:hypothetical protein